MEEIKILQRPAEINFDFDAAEEYLTTRVNSFKGVVITEETTKDGKELRAQLNKEQKELIEREKEAKKEYMKPFEAFDTRMQRLIKLYDQPIKDIADQLAAFEEQRKQEKRALINTIYGELICEDEIKELLPIRAIYNPKWENATFTEKKIREEIMEAKIAGKTALETIKQMHSEKEAEAIEIYRQHRDLSSCILFINNYEQEKRDILAREQERARQEEMERIRQEERAKIEAEQLQQKREQEAADAAARAAEEAAEEARAETIEQFIPEDNAQAETPYGYIIKLTPDGKNKLEMFMDSIGIEYSLMEF